MDKRWKSHCGSSVCYRDKRNYDKAYLFYKEWLQYYPEDVSALVACAEMQMMRGEAKDAMKLYEKVLALDADNLQANIFLGNYYYLQAEQKKKTLEDNNKEAYDMNYAYIAANEPENFTFANLVNRENCLTGESFVSHNIMDYAISHSDQFTPEQRARIRHVLLYSPLIPGLKAVQEADTRSAPDGLMELPIRTAK